MSNEESKLLVRGFVEQVINNRRLDVAGDYMAEDVVEQVPFPGQGPGLGGAEGRVARAVRDFPGHALDHRGADRHPYGRIGGCTAECRAIA